MYLFLPLRYTQIFSVGRESNKSRTEFIGCCVVLYKRKVLDYWKTFISFVELLSNLKRSKLEKISLFSFFRLKTLLMYVTTRLLGTDLFLSNCTGFVQNCVGLLWYVCFRTQKKQKKQKRNYLLVLRLK